MTIQHREVEKHINGDVLSRIIEDGCPFTRTSHYGRRAHEKWGEFFDNVDDVVPLNVINM